MGLLEVEATCQPLKSSTILHRPDLRRLDNHATLCVHRVLCLQRSNWGRDLLLHNLEPHTLFGPCVLYRLSLNNHRDVVKRDDDRVYEASVTYRHRKCIECLEENNRQPPNDLKEVETDRLPGSVAASTSRHSLEQAT